MMKKNLIGIFFTLLTIAGIVQTAFSGESATALKRPSSEQLNKGAVSIITGGVNGTYIRIAADMSSVLDTDNLRILPIIGKGSIQNINDLLYLKGVDMAIVQSDVLEYLRRQGIHRNMEKRIYYITKLYNEEFHLLANDQIKSSSDLVGRKVNFDTKGSGTSMTASIVFDMLNISVEPTYYDQATALEKLKSGQIDALVYVAGKPAQLFEKLTTADSLHFISIDPVQALLKTYLPTQLGNQDYPNLIKSDEEVKTIAVGAMLAVYNWKPKSDRYQKVANFVHHFFERFDGFQDPARHPKWREVSLSAVIPGWTRFQPAQEWLESPKK